MLYLLALVGLVTLIVLMWKAFGPRSVDAHPGERCTRAG